MVDAPVVPATVIERALLDHDHSSSLTGRSGGFHDLDDVQTRVRLDNIANLPGCKEEGDVLQFGRVYARGILPSSLPVSWWLILRIQARRGDKVGAPVVLQNPCRRFLSSESRIVAHVDCGARWLSDPVTASRTAEVSIWMRNCSC
jgi:hypothetical protein